MNKYFVITSLGPMENDRGDVIYFDTFTEATHFAENYCDLSDKDLRIIKVGK